MKSNLPKVIQALEEAYPEMKEKRIKRRKKTPVKKSMWVQLSIFEEDNLGDSNAVNGN